MNYTVKWVIDVEADSSTEAAKQALKIQRDEGSTATVFVVQDKDSCHTEVVDLEDLTDHKADILRQLKEEFPNCWFKPGEEFDGNEARIVWSGEGSYIGDSEAFDYYASGWDAKEDYFTMGIHNELKKFCEDKGYYWQCNDPGTYFLFKL